MASDTKEVWVTCAECGHGTKKHIVLHEKKTWVYFDPDYPPELAIMHRLVECAGCESIKYAVSEIDLHDPEERERDFKIYPDAPFSGKRRAPAIDTSDASDDAGNLLIPEAVWKMYRETIDALNGGIRTLAGGGLRATVEAICLNNGINHGNLQRKIDELAEKKLLTEAQAALLHEERYLGNAALHELATPSVQDIEDGLGIVEGLITTIYVLPEKAQRLKERREAKAAPAPASPKKPPKAQGK